MEQTVYLENLSCQNCVKHVTDRFLQLEGVRQVRVDLASQTASLETDRLHSADDYQSALTKTIYKVKTVS